MTNTQFVPARPGDTPGGLAPGEGDQPQPVDLPLLEEPCPNCTSPEYVEERDRAHRNNTEWHERESSGFRAWVATREAEGNVNAWDPEIWRNSAAYEALGPEPELWPDTGCVECDYIGTVATPAGRLVLGFMRRHGGKTKG